MIVHLLIWHFMYCILNHCRFLSWALVLAGPASSLVGKRAMNLFSLSMWLLLGGRMAVFVSLSCWMASRFAFSVLTCESQCMRVVHLTRYSWICENILYNFNCKNVRKEAQSSGLGTKRRNFLFESGLLQKEKMAIEAFQICCLLLPPENRRKLQLLMRMMARICLNKEMPPLCDGFGTRTLVGGRLPSTVTPVFNRVPVLSSQLRAGVKLAWERSPLSTQTSFAFSLRTLENMV